jgi:uncharacterized repeat protein (TIGR03806 family)
VAVAVAAIGCAGKPTCISLPGSAGPALRLSELRLFNGSGDSLTPRPALIPYRVRTAFYSDGESKERFIAVPPGSKVIPTEGDWQLPRGSLLVKTFYVPADARLPDRQRRRLETRILQRAGDGFIAAVYAWNPEQTEAICSDDRAEVPLSVVAADGRRRDRTFVIPRTAICPTCHNGSPTGQVARALGWKTWQLDVRDLDRPSGERQLERFQRQGLLETTPAPVASRAALAEAARTYLDVNCAPCHSPQGLAAYQGLSFERDNGDPWSLGIRRPATSFNGREVAIVPGHPERSALVARMVSSNPAARMPISSNLTVDAEGLELMESWIDSLDPSAQGTHRLDPIGRFGVGAQVGFSTRRDAVVPVALTGRWERDDVLAFDAGFGLPGSGLGLSLWAQAEATLALSRITLLLSRIRVFGALGPMVGWSGSALAPADAVPEASRLHRGPLAEAARGSVGLRWSWLRGRIDTYLAADGNVLLRPEVKPLVAATLGMRFFVPKW